MCVYQTKAITKRQWMLAHLTLWVEEFQGKYMRCEALLQAEVIYHQLEFESHIHKNQLIHTH